MRFKSVVLPAPKNPVSIVTGTMSSRGIGVLGEALVGEVMGSDLSKTTNDYSTAIERGKSKLGAALWARVHWACIKRHPF
jgi:hypothetical protein